MLKDKIGEVIADAPALNEAVDRIARQDDVFFSRRFLLPRPLLGAILADEPVVLLIDEIDKADTEFEAFLLEVLSDFQVTVPELGTIKARHMPLVVLTSNNARELSDALKRRCLHLFIDFPGVGEELAIIRLKVPGRRSSSPTGRERGPEDPRARAQEGAVGLGEPRLGARARAPERRPARRRARRSTLTLVVKHERDLERVKASLDKVLADW